MPAFCCTFTGHVNLPLLRLPHTGILYVVAVRDYLWVAFYLPHCLPVLPHGAAVPLVTLPAADRYGLHTFTPCCTV